MGYNVEIEQVKSIEEYIDDLSDLLIQVIEDDASIGFLPPLPFSDAIKYWRNVLSPEVHLFVAKINNRVVGSVQLQLCSKQNGVHRAEIAKLMTHPHYRRNGIGRALMNEVEEQAKQEAGLY